MMISVPVNDAMMREATNRGMTIEAFIDSLIDKGMKEATQPRVVGSAIDRIRQLRTDVIGSK